MKVIALLLASGAAAAVAEESASPESIKLSAAIIEALSASLPNLGESGGSDGKPLSLSAGDWMSQLACTADMSDPNNPTIIDETACAAAQDSESQPCVWCDATATLGQGLCAGASQKAMLSMFWDSICATSDGSDNTDGGKDKAAPTPPAPIVPVPVTTPAPTPNPTPNPTAPTPDPPSGDDPMACTMDGQTPIQDEAACEARDDPAGGKCAWCEIKLIGGGACSTAQAKAQLSWMCKSEEEEEAAAKAGNLRGDFKNLDPSCLSDKGGCASKTDSTGKPCVWCEAGDNVFGICATPNQEASLGSYLTCGSGAEVAPDGGEESRVAVE